MSGRDEVPARPRSSGATGGRPSFQDQSPDRVHLGGGEGTPEQVAQFVQPQDARNNPGAVPGPRRDVAKRVLLDVADNLP